MGSASLGLRISSKCPTLSTVKRRRNQGQSATFDLVKVRNFDLSKRRSAGFVAAKCF